MKNYLLILLFILIQYSVFAQDNQNIPCFKWTLFREWIPQQDTGNIISKGYSLITELESQKYNKKDLKAIKFVNKKINKILRKCRNSKHFIGLGRVQDCENPKETFPMLMVSYKPTITSEELRFIRVYNEYNELILVEVYKCKYLPSTEKQIGWFLFIDNVNCKVILKYDTKKRYLYD